MYGWGPFPTAPAVGGIYYGALIEPWTAWLIVAAGLVVACGTLWAIGGLSRTPDDKDRTPTREITKAAA
jgi:hypothetical protein